MLTILGPGGTGKTRFAIELARLLAEDADGGTVFVPLAPLRDPDLVVPALADRLGAASPDVAALAARVGDRRTHAIVDNVEHLLPNAARPLAALVAASPALRLVVTSREPLRVQGEQELDLPPLAEREAVDLFLARARAVRPDVERTPAVSELCRRLDHLPLALELAAARTKLLAPHALLARLGASLDLLQGTRDADERHTTLRATIAWSYDLLPDDEQRLFRRLAVFRGGCTLESAEMVCVADLDTLASLLDKSLVRRRTGPLGEERYWMLETIREFALAELLASEEAEAIRRRHAERMLEIARSAHLTEEDDEPFRLRLVLAEQDDMRGALDWATAQDIELALELLVSMENFWNTHALEEVLTRLDELLPRADGVPAPLRAGALRLRGGALHTLGDFVSCDTPYAESLTLYRVLGDERGVASLLQRLGNSAYQRGEFEKARDLLEQSQKLARGRFALIEVPNETILARIRILTGDVGGGTEQLRRSGEMAGEVGFDWWRSGVLGHLAFLALDRGDVDEARRDSKEALRIVRENEGRWGTFMPLTALACVALACGERRRAGVLWGAVDAEDARAPNRAWRARRAERARPLLEETHGDFAAGVEQGHDVDVWDAVAIALGELEPPQTVP